MIMSTFAQCLDAIFGAPTGMDVIIDHVEQYMNARRFIASLKFVG